jgi:hypothetical protein
MAFYTKGSIPWNSLNDNTRGPLASELEGGYPCGEADQQLFNWTTGYPVGQIYNVILEAGLTPDFTDLTQLNGALSSLYPRLLKQDLNLYVRPDGNDNNTGLENTAAGAFRQVQAALDAVSRYVLLGYVANIRVADGTYDAFIATNTGGADIRVIGNVSNPGNVIVNGGSLDAIRAIRGSTLNIQGMRINAPAAGKMCLLAFDRSNISFSNVIFGAAGLSHIYASGASLVRATGPYSISGSAQNHILAGTTSVIEITGVTATITTALSFTSFVEANNGTILAAGTGFPGAGSVTGARYLAQVVGVIYTAGGGANFFAGSTPGSVVTGGTYI